MCFTIIGKPFPYIIISFLFIYSNFTLKKSMAIYLALGWNSYLVWAMVGKVARASRGSFTVRSSCPRSFLPSFLLLPYYDSGVCILLLFHPCCSLRRVLCWIHTSCMGSPFHIVLTRLSLVFRFSCNIFAESKDP